ncbi:MAG: 30S ribosome-binding factor RbfA [Acidimicrobiia bacterium]|nr:30S ribosome-binding factor RbfA [Acidimicrobiia bacterium]
MTGRMAKVNSVIKEVLAEEIERMNDTRLEMVSVTGVETAPNLRHAVVYVDALGPEGHEAALIALRRAAVRLQRAIGAQVRLKYTPILEFEIDPAVIGGERIDSILRMLSAEDRESE